MKVCTRCGENKANNLFFKRKAKLSSHCKACELIKIQEWRQKNPDKNAAIDRRARLKSVYGITTEQYDELLATQSGNCAVCFRSHTQFPQRLSIDHNHKTGEIRGLLCTYCNHRVVGRHTDGELLRRLAAYVEQGTGWFVPPKKKKRKKSGKNSPRNPR